MDEQSTKKPKRAYSQAQNRASQKYHAANLDRIYLCVRKGDKEKYQKLAESKKLSLSALIVELLDNELKKTGE